jgi:hypothetical protein
MNGIDHDLLQVNISGILFGVTGKKQGNNLFMITGILVKIRTRPGRV